jgi:hypothetical protein
MFLDEAVGASRVHRSSAVQRNVRAIACQRWVGHVRSSAGTTYHGTKLVLRLVEQCVRLRVFFLPLPFCFPLCARYVLPVYMVHVYVALTQHTYVHV